MKKHVSGSLAVACLSGLALFHCNQIAGINEPLLDTSEGGTNTGTTDGGAPDTSQPGAGMDSGVGMETGTQSQPEAGPQPMPEAGKDEDTGAPTACVGGGTRCVGNDSQTCSGSGTWEDAGACPGGCSGSSCITVTAIAAGASHTCALLSDTSVKCWGLNANGQIGDGTTMTRNTPVPVSGLTGVTAVSAGTAHTCALLKGGTVECWGSNSSGQLGDGTSMERHTPVAATGLTGVSQVAAGSQNTCAITPSNANSTVQCWGANASGFFSSSAPTPEPTPTASGPLNGVSQISVGDGFLCALDTVTNEAYCMGQNTDGDLGTGNTSSSNGTPGNVATQTSPYLMYGTAIYVGTESMSACAIIPNQTAGQPNGIYCWGDNSSGQLGIGSSPAQALVATPIPSLSGVTAVSVGLAHACALLQKGTVDCWGDGTQGDLGLGSAVPSSVPVAVPGLSGVTGIAAGDYHSCALLAGGTEVDCWGYNMDGELGNGPIAASSSSPTPVTW